MAKPNMQSTIREALEWWLATSQARALIEVPIGARTEQEWIDSMRQRIESAYLAGYDVGFKAGCNFHQSES